MTRLRDQIAAQIADYYIVKIDEQVYIHEPSAEQRGLLGRGDVFVADRGSFAPGGSTTAVASSASPAKIVLPQIDFESLSFLEIRDKRNRQLVTVIELLSPSNKYSGPDRDREQYLVKRAGLLKSWAHLVEIDLLRGGPRMPFATPLPKCDYYVMVSRRDQRPRAELWPIPLRDPLPSIPIPVREPDPDAMLDLQAALNQVYDGAKYKNYIYEGLPEPQLNPEDAEWAQTIVATP